MKTPNIAELNVIQKIEAELALLFFIVIVGSLVISSVEHISYFNAFYFSLVTLAGIGYGDIVPHTTIGKIVVMLYALVGLPLFITMGYLISSLFLNPIKKTRKRILKSKNANNQDTTII